MFTGEKLLLKSQPFITTFPVSPSEWMAKFPTQVSDEIFCLLLFLASTHVHGGESVWLLTVACVLVQNGCDWPKTITFQLHSKFRSEWLKHNMA